MGCNFYDQDGNHIGKRSAAGMYCWNDSITLCMSGNDGIHTGFSEWYDKCPMCGMSPQKEKINQSSAGRELGFNTGDFIPKKGVRSASSFTWAMSPDDLGKASSVTDEYGRLYTKREFYNMLKECPVRFYDSIGREFS